MALTRSLLKALGLNDEQISSIIEAHTDTITGLKDSLKTAEEKAKRFDDVEKELNEIKKANSGKEDFKTKYENEHTAFEKYKSDVTAKETKAAKEKAVSTYYESKNIIGKNLSIAMRGSKAEIDGIELDESGKIKDTSVLDTLISGDFAGLVSTERTEGANTINPPTNTGGDTFDKLPLYEKMKYANEHPNDASVKAFLGK